MSCVTLLPPASVALTDAARGTASAIQCAAIKMGREQRRKRLLPEGQRCYLCGDVIGSSEEWNRDHVPPRAIFASSVRKEHNPNLDSLVTHTGCNSSHQLDEEYFIVSLAGLLGTRTASAVMGDIRKKASEGSLGPLIREVLSRFGKVIGPNGERTYTYDTVRVERALWKIVRGLYTLLTGEVLPEGRKAVIWLVQPGDPPGEVRESGLTLCSTSLAPGPLPAVPPRTPI